ncbi:hypothetical protein [Burkholderia sp. SIMBA_062]
MTANDFAICGYFATPVSAALKMMFVAIFIACRCNQWRAAAGR